MDNQGEVQDEKWAEKGLLWPRWVPLQEDVRGVSCDFPRFLARSSAL